MKNQIKNILLYLGLFYVLVVSILMIYTVCSQNNKISFDNVDYYEKRINESKDKIKSLKKDECTKNIQLLIDESLNTYYVGEYNINEIYNTDSKWISTYRNTMDTCKTTNNSLEDISALAIAASLQHEETFQRILYKYQLNIFDKGAEFLKPNLNGVENVIRKNLEAEVIEQLIEVRLNEK